MRRPTVLPLLLSVAVACGQGPPADEIAPADTALTLDGGGSGMPAESEEPSTTTTGAATTASSAEATGAPSPPGGYAIESRPMNGGALAVIEYVSPRSPGELADFYDRQMQSVSRIELEVAGENVVVYGLGTGTSIGPATRIQDVERLLEQRTESMVVVAPYRMSGDDPLIGDLRDAGQQAQADALLQTRSKVSVVYAVH
jgi:hypothetical protein